MSLESPIPEWRNGASGQEMAECDCPTPGQCQAFGCEALRRERLRPSPSPASWGSSVPAAKSRAAILDAAREAVMVDRAATHGDVEDSFGLIAALWSAYLGRELRPLDAALMLGLLKVARAKGNPGHADNFVDLAGYAACAGELGDG